LEKPDAHIRGFAAQGTLNVSALGESPIFFETEGFTGGIAAYKDLLVGFFEGYAFAASGPDYWNCEIVGYRCGRCGCRPIYRPVKHDSKAGAGMGAEIEMFGSSYSESYRYVNYDCGTKTEGMGTNVGAFTTVYSHGYDYDWDKGLSCSYADVDGGWIAAGGAASLTVQEGPAGNAKASAIGIYVGCGQLGDNYNGSAEGYTNTSVTTFNGMGGSINQASSGMVVNSGNNAGQQLVD